MVCDVSLSGHKSGSVQHQHRRALCHPQRIYPFTLLQVRLCRVSYSLLSVKLPFLQNVYRVVEPHQIKVCPPICLKQAPPGEPSRPKSGHHRVRPLPVSLQGDAHQGFLQAV